mmetsp:Transcript_15913/g.40556  ORF Transcript_15913/g.40556 Transcript_15913/m.40556 type:complete len:229 (-) Transcript_15913:461-1147(-)
MFSTQAIPSSSALWASMGPSMASPMAYTEGTLVWKWLSTLMRPTLSVSIPRASRPMLRVNGRLPVLTSTTSASKVVAAPPAEGSRVSFTPSPTTSEAVTLVLSMNFMPCFFKIFRKAWVISLSMPGVMVSRNSTTVTSAPSLRHTEPISRPMTPPPTTTIFLGTAGKSRAPVESTMRCLELSTTQVGRGVTSEPTARMMCLASMVWLPPAFKSTLTELAPESLPKPFT